MNNLILKNCKNCGPLTKDKVRFNKSKNIFVCKNCESISRKKSWEKYPDKRKAHREKFRYLERDSSTKEMRCSKCKNIKSISEFHKHMLNIRYPYCIVCRNDQTKRHHSTQEWKEKQKKLYQEKYQPISRERHYKKHYGISLEDYEEILKKQNNVCAICKKPETAKKKLGISFLSVDHCHELHKKGIMKIRGLLCLKCNTAIGNFLHLPELCLSAAEYLKNNS